MDLALLIIAAKVFLGKDESDVEKFCSNMTPGSPAHIACIEQFQRLK